MKIPQEYLERIAKGDMDAFEFLFILYQPKVKVFIHKLIRNEEDTNDLTQDIFLKIWNTRSNLTTIQYFTTYLFQMSKNAVFDYFQRKSHFSETGLLHESMLPYLHEADYNIEESIEARDLELLIDTYLETMPPQQKKIFAMSRKDGLSNDEISKQLDISKRTVETHISNTLKGLRKFLSQIISLFL